MSVNIHNQCTNFKLTNRKYFSHGLWWDLHLDKEIEAGGTTSADLRTLMEVSEGAIMYQLKKMSN
jgi:hypothetical protein